MVTTHIPNERWARQAVYAYQSVPETGVSPTRRFRGDWASDWKPSNATRPEATGMRARRVTPRHGRGEYSGSYAEDVAFQDFGSFLRSALRSGGTGPLVSGASTAREFVKSPDLYALGLDYLTVDHFVEGLGFRDIGAFFNQWNLAIDVDDADGVWKVSGTPMARAQVELPGSFEGVATGGTTTTVVQTGAGHTVDAHIGKWVNIGVNHTGYIRQIVDNDGTTLTFAPAVPVAVAAGTKYRIEGKFPTGIATPAVDLVPSYGTRLFLNEVGDIGETQIVGRVISTNMTVNHQAGGKTFLENDINEVGRESLDELLVTGQIRVELDRRDEYLAFRRNEKRALRIQSPNGPLIETVGGDPIYHSIGIDLPVMHFTDITKDERGNNLTATLAWEALLPLGNLETTIVTDVATV